MSLESWLAYVATVLAIMIAPGPSHLLMLSNSMAYGGRRALATAAGDLSANALQMLAAGLGLAAILVTAQGALAIVKWAGVAYLIWMGLGMLRRAGTARRQPGAGAAGAPAVLWLQGFVTSAVNPKAVVFFAALFPQFIDPELPFLPQFLTLSITYLVLDGSFLVTYGIGANWIAARFRGRADATVARIGGAALLGAAILLALKTLRGAG